MAKARRAVEVEPEPDTAPQPEGLPEFLDDGFPNPKAMEPWEYMQRLTPEQWEAGNVQAYVYRAHPRVMRTSGKSAYLDVLNRALTIDEVKERWGGGVYELYIKRNREPVYTKWAFPIEGTPKYESWEKPIGTNGADKGAAAAASPVTSELLGDMIHDVMRQRDIAQEQELKFDPYKALRDSMGLLNHAARASIEMLVKQTVPPPSLSEMLTVVSKLQEMGGGRTPASGDLLTTLQTLRELGVLGGGSQQNPLSGMRDLLGLLRELRDEAGGDSGKQNPWTILASKADGILERVAHVATEFRRTAELRVLGRYAEQGAARHSGQLAQPFAQPIMPSATNNDSPAAGAGQPGPAAGPPPSGEQVQQYGILMIKNLLVEMLHRGDDGTSAGLAIFRLSPEFASELAQRLERRDPALAQDESFRHVFTCGDCGEVLADFTRDFCRAITELRQHGHLLDDEEEGGEEKGDAAD